MVVVNQFLCVYVMSDGKFRWDRESPYVPGETQIRAFSCTNKY